MFFNKRVKAKTRNCLIIKKLLSWKKKVLRGSEKKKKNTKTKTQV